MSLELKLLQADRLAALGTLAAGVAHEVNNPLGYLSSNLNFIGEALAELKQELSDPNGPRNPDELRRTLVECVEALDEAKQGTQRIREVVGDLTTFARGEDWDARDGLADVRWALETSLNMAMPQLRHRARVVRNVGELRMRQVRQHPPPASASGAGEDVHLENAAQQSRLVEPRCALTPPARAHPCCRCRGCLLLARPRHRSLAQQKHLALIVDEVQPLRHLGEAGVAGVGVGASSSPEAAAAGISGG